MIFYLFWIFFSFNYIFKQQVWTEAEQTLAAADSLKVTFLILKNLYKLMYIYLCGEFLLTIYECDSVHVIFYSAVIL